MYILIDYTLLFHYLYDKDFYSCVGDENGALLFAVFRGKISEGMDFRDHQARAVVSVYFSFNFYLKAVQMYKYLFIIIYYDF